MATTHMTPQIILDFWAGLDEKLYFTRDDGLDAEMADRFSAALTDACNGVFDGWAAYPDGALALTVLLDQFSRNIHRATPKAFAADEKARSIASLAIEKGFDTQVPADQRRWFYMPYMHSEVLSDQERSIELFTAAGLEANVPYAIEHADIIRRFGRFPHRNAILGRSSTKEEIDFLENGGFSG